MSIAAFVPPFRIASLTKLRCSIFQTSYNPSSIRTGAKYLRRRLRGPSMATYYPGEFEISKITKKLGIPDEDEVDRFADIAERKRRGKGAPKKAKSEGESRRLHRKR